MDKTVATAQEAVADIVSGSTIAAGGFACGTPRSSAKLYCTVMPAGVPDPGAVPAGRLRRIVAS
jgi:acyl CoA:acetate/3-ketoacid CoA transferase alpha subunit